MSCFTIDKQSYARVGAILGAFTEITKRFNEPLLYKWNFEKNRLSNCDDIINDILKLYTINAISVEISWNKQPKNLFEIDDNYLLELDNTQVNKEDYLKYKNYIIMLEKKRHIDIKYQRELEKVLYSVHHFFRSVNYQIDDLNLNKQASNIMNVYESYILEILKQLKNINIDSNDIDSWGAFEINFNKQ